MHKGQFSELQTNLLKNEIKSIISSLQNNQNRLVKELSSEVKRLTALIPRKVIELDNELENEIPFSKANENSTMNQIDPGSRDKKDDNSELISSFDRSFVASDLSSADNTSRINKNKRLFTPFEILLSFLIGAFFAIVSNNLFSGR